MLPDCFHYSAMFFANTDRTYLGRHELLGHLGYSLRAARSKSPASRWQARVFWQVESFESQHEGRDSGTKSRGFLGKTAHLAASRAVRGGFGRQDRFLNVLENIPNMTPGFRLPVYGQVYQTGRCAILTQVNYCGVSAGSVQPENPVGPDQSIAGAGADPASGWRIDPPGSSITWVTGLQFRPSHFP